MRIKKEWLFHLLGCIVFLSIPFINTDQRDQPGILMMNRLAMHDFIRYVLLLIFFYLNYFLLIPRLFFTGNKTIYFILLFVIMLLIAFVPQGIVNGNPPPMPGSPGEGFGGPPPRDENFFFARIDHNLFLFIAVAFFSLLIRINNRWQQSEREKAETELSYLKAQINPHFLFNTLNSIYSLAIQESDRTPEAVQKLSAMMRYVLSEHDNTMVPLQKEIDHISNYIDLQRLRFGDGIRLNYVVEGNFSSQQIAPLILVSFIENAFKYGVNAEEESLIDIAINLQEKRLTMQVTNNIVTINERTEEQTGIGLENTASRLNLAYPNAHQLRIEENEKTYRVNLSIDLL